MGQLTPLTLDDGTTIYIEATETHASNLLVPDYPTEPSEPKRGLFPAAPAKQIALSFDAIEATIRAYTTYTLSAVTTSPATMQFHSDIATQDWLPMGGWVNVAVNTLGQFTVSGHMHDSGFPNIDYALAIVIVTPSGMGYTFPRQGHVDGTVTIFGRNRDDDWTIPGVNLQMAQNWDEVTQARLFWKLTAQDTLSAGIQGLIEDVAKEGAKALGAAGIRALIALI